MSEDWLEAETPGEDWLDVLDPRQVEEIVHREMMDETSTALRNKSRALPAGLPKAEESLVAALRALQPRQRLYLRAYLQAACSRASASRLLRQSNVEVPGPSVISRWFVNPHFFTALELLKKRYLATAGLDPSSVMLKAGKIYDVAMAPQPILYMGEPTGYEEVDLTNAMRAVEFAGKVNRMTTGDDGSTRVTLNIVNIADKELRDVVSEQ